MSRYQAGEFEGSSLREFPQDFAVLHDRKTLCIRVIVLHVRKFLHQLGVLAVLGRSRKNEFVVVSAVVFHNEEDVFALAHGDTGGFESHFLPVVAHDDFNSTGGFFGVARLAGGKLRAIRRYLATRDDNLPWLFVSERQDKLTRFAVNYLVERTAKAGGFDNLPPHCLRHSCGYALADKGIDLRTIQEWLGHRSIEMTVRYTRISQRRFNGLWR